MTEQTGWMIGLLGSFRLERDGEVVEQFGTRREELLLAHLALTPQAAHLRTSVVEALWPGKDPAAALRNLSYNLCVLRDRLRKLGLHDGLHVSRDTLQLNPGTATDVQELDACVLAAAHHEDRARRAALQQQTLAL